MRIYTQAARGCKFYYGNFTLGIAIDSHPMGKYLIIGLLLFDVVFAWEKSK